MKTTAIFTITSGLHDEKTVSSLSDSFLGDIFPDREYDFYPEDFSAFGEYPLNLIYVRTGGAEGIFKELFPDIRRKCHGPVYLLTSGKSNSLAASMEILSYLRQQGIPGEILHGPAGFIAGRIALLEKVESARKTLSGCRIGMVGAPSDWLIASHASPQAVKEKLGADIVEVPMDALLAAIAGAPEGEIPDGLPMKTDVSRSYPGAVQIYEALRTVRRQYDLQALTLRCFDLLTAVGNTGCFALARFNAEGVPSSCEGDVPALLSMMIAHALTGCTGFQANPSRIDIQGGELIFAHCTIPLNIPRSVQYDTHFESGIGVGIHGEFPEGPVTVFKVSGSLDRCFVAEGELLRNQYEDNLCRTQVVVRLTPEEAGYFLTDPIGNHHILIPGHHRAVLEAFVASVGTECHGVRK